MNVLLESDDDSLDADEQHQTFYDSEGSLAFEQGPYQLSGYEFLERMILKKHTAYLFITVSVNSQVSELDFLTT